jgi:hypothetical protein
LPTRDSPVRAVNEDALAAGIAVEAASAEPPDSHPITNREPLNTLAEFGYRSGDFVPKGQWP